jgi:hypothetical protein
MRRRGTGRIVMISALTTIVGTWVVTKFGRGARVPGFTR